MADTRVQTEVEDWIRAQWMPRTFGVRFFRNRLRLTSGGVFDFDAVSEDDMTVACVSTSSGKTARGKLAVGKLMKLRADMLFLLLARDPQRRLMILTEKDMYEVCQKEREAGRTPPGIEFHVAEIPETLRVRLESARKKASQEVTRDE